MRRYFIAVMLTALFLIPFFAAHAEDNPAFSIDQRRVLQGMNRSWLQGYEAKISGNVLSLVLPLLSEQAEGQIQTEWVMPDESISPFKPQTMSVKTQRAEGGLYPVRFNLELYSDRENGDYACILRVTGKDGQGNALQTDFPYTLHIRDGMPNTEHKRITISDVRSDLTVGEDGMIHAVLQNPCRTVNFERLVLRITDASGEIIPREVDVIYLPDLAPGESIEVNDPVTVLAKAAVVPHSLRFDLSWTALEQTITQTESYTLHVRQEIRLEQGGLKMASSVIAGDSVTLTLPLMNMGKADLINVLATVSLSGITDRQSVLVGTIAPGETRQAQLTLTPGKDVVGDFEGSLLVEGTDQDGNAASLSLPVSVTVEKPISLPVIDDVATAAENPPMLIYAFGGGCALLLLLLIIQGIWLRRKIHRLEEDKL